MQGWFLYQQKMFKQANLYQNMIFYIQKCELKLYTGFQIKLEGKTWIT